ncbi:hypothetical protein N9N28_11490 [Rubripirellula amarantea]|nr:hypothetical protein [Rubripirellula amarantea]
MAIGFRMPFTFQFFPQSRHRIPTLKLRIIQTLDRYELENRFVSRHSHAIISVRRPGSRFAKSRFTENCVAQLDLMLHEWDVDNPPYPLPFVLLTARQATKLADFVGEQCQQVNQLIIQSEFASSQRSAIAEAIGDWTGAFLDRGDVWPSEHEPTNELLQMAFDAFEMSGKILPRSSAARSSEEHQIQQLIEFICTQTNVALISSSRIQKCFTLSAERRNDIDVSLGVCLDQDQRCYRRHSTFGTGSEEKVDVDLQTILTSYQRRVCCNEGCPTCLQTLRRWNMPFCLAIIFDARHLPETFEHVLEAGANWAIIASEETMDRIEGIAGPHRKVKATRISKNCFGLVTIGDAIVCDVLHEIYRVDSDI